MGATWFKTLVQHVELLLVFDKRWSTRWYPGRHDLEGTINTSVNDCQTHIECAFFVYWILQTCLTGYNLCSPPFAQTNRYMTSLGNNIVGWSDQEKNGVVQDRLKSHGPFML